jgi:RNA polymerase sigma-70 factor (ECF subfamily)
VGEGAVRVALHRLRRRFGEVIREEIGRTVEGPEDVDDELRRLLEVFRPL